jgi:CRP-like cAMP-binding protein
MASTSASPKQNVPAPIGPTRNLLLRRLPPAELEWIAPHLRRVTFDFKETLYETGGTVESVYFVESGVISIVKDLEDGGTVETGTVGNEGLVGVPVLLGVPRAAERAFCQIPGYGHRMPAPIAIEARSNGSVLGNLMLRSSYRMLAMVSQTAACNRAHPVNERMARWLLMTHDRVEGDEFPLTQEFLAQMLGVRRPSVNTAGLALQQAGLIRYSRGRITIVNREGLEASACECYLEMVRDFSSALE